MTMLSTTGEHVVYVIMFWLVQLEVSLCEDMFGSLDGRTSLAYPAIWPRPPTEALRRLLPNVAHEWCRKAGVRWLVARAGLAAGVVAAAAPPLRPAATPAFLVIYAVECYCFFVKFGAHMHFAPLLLAWGTHVVDRRARYRGLFLLCVAAQTYASSGFWRGLQFYRTGVPGDVVEGTYGVSLKHFTTNLFGMAPRLRARVLACSERFLGAAFLAVTLAFEGLVWVLVVGLEVALVALPPGGRRDAVAACQAWVRVGLAASVVAFHQTNFMVLGMFFGSMSFVVAVVLLCSPSALDDAVDEASPGSHAYALANVLALAVASYHCREVFPFNANGLFSYATCHATLLSTAWVLTDATELALLIVGPGQSLEAAARENRRPCPLGVSPVGGWVAGRLPSPPARAFCDEIYRRAAAAALLDDPKDARGGPRRLAGYPGVADIVLGSPELLAMISAMKRDLAATKPFYDVVAQSDDFTMILAEVDRKDGVQRVVRVIETP